MPDSNEFPYKAFISYRKLDKNIARQLKRYLEHCCLPPLPDEKTGGSRGWLSWCGSVIALWWKNVRKSPLTVGNVYLDAYDLLSGNVSEAIERGLSHSEALIVLCSENTNIENKSKKLWVEAECRYFMAALLSRYLSEKDNSKYKGKICLVFPMDDRVPDVGTNPEYSSLVEFEPAPAASLDASPKERLTRLIRISDEIDAKTQNDIRAALAKLFKRWIVPLLLPRDTSIKYAEYIPPAIRGIGIEAIDMADLKAKSEERINIYNRVAASLLNVDTVTLRNRVKMIERRRRKIRRSVQTSSAVTLGAMGFFSWDFFVPKYTYYENYVEQNCIPVGRGKLSEQETRNRAYHYRFTHRYYRLQSVECRDSFGFLFDPSCVEPLERPAVSMHFRYAEDDAEPRFCEYRDIDNKRLVTLEICKSEPCANEEPWKHSKVVYYRKTNSKGMDLGHVRASNFFYALTKQTRELADINRVQVVLDAHGYVEKEYYQDVKGNPRQNAEGAYGRFYKRLPDGRIEQMRYLSKSDLDTKGLTLKSCSFETSNKLAGYVIEYQDEDKAKMYFVHRNGERAVSQTIFEITREKGCVKQVDYYEATGNLHSEGVAKKCLLHMPSESRNRLEFRDAGNELTLSDEGIAACEYSYDAAKKRRQVQYFGADDKPLASWEVNYEGRGMTSSYVVDSSSAEEQKKELVSYASEYDSENREIKRTYLDAAGKPSWNEEQGCVGYTVKYERTHHGQITTFEYFDTDGKVCTNAQGYARYRVIYQDKDGVVIITEESLDEGGNPVMNVAGHHKKVEKYNTAGCLTSMEYMDTEGFSALAPGERFSSVLLEYDETNLELTRIKALSGKMWFAGVFGLETEKMAVSDETVSARIYFTDKKGKRVMGRMDLGSWVAGARIALNKERFTAEFIDARGEPCENTDGMSKIVSETSDDGKRKLSYSYDLQGNYKPSRAGHYKEETCKMPDGRTKKMYQDLNGAPWVNTEGIAGVIESEQSEKGNGERGFEGTTIRHIYRITEEFVDKDGNPSNDKLWRRKKVTEEWVLGAENRTIRMLYYLNEQEEKVCFKKGYYQLCEEIMPDGALKQLFYDENGSPCLDSDGVAGGILYTLPGNVARVRFLGRDGNVAKGKLGSYGVEEWRNSHDRLERTVFLDETGSRMECKTGHAEEYWRYDAQGALKSMRCINLSGEETHIKEYDESERVVRELELSPDSVRCERLMDEKNRVYQFVYLDEKKEPKLTEHGFAGCRVEYSESDEVEKMVLIDENLNPVMVPRGFAGWRSEFSSDSGVETLRMYLNADAQPVMTSMGYAGWKREYDENENLKYVYFLDETGTPCLTPRGYCGWRDVTTESSSESRYEFMKDEKTPAITPKGYTGFVMKYNAETGNSDRYYLMADGSTGPRADDLLRPEECLELLQLISAK